MASFEDKLRDFELELNPDKIQMLSGPQHIERPWLFRLRSIEQRNSISTDLLLEMFSFVAEIAHNYPHDHVFRYFLRKMRNMMVANEAWNSYQRILLSVFQENRGNAKEVFDQFLYYRCIGWKLDLKSLKEALDRKVQNQLSRGATSELSWAIYGYILFNIKPTKELAMKILLKGDVPSKVMITKLIYGFNISLKSEVNSIVRSWSEDVLNSSEWLFAYEVLRNSWHNRYAQVHLPANRQLYEFMKDSNVSFLDESNLGLTELPAVFRRHTSVSGGVDLFDFLSNDEVESVSPEADDDVVDTISYPD